MYSHVSLCIVVGAGDAKRHELAARTLSLGRRSGNDVVLLDPLVSSNHAVIKDGVLVDLNSTNGTHITPLGCKRAQALDSGVRHTLVAGDVFRMGNTDIRVLRLNETGEIVPPGNCQDGGSDCGDDGDNDDDDEDDWGLEETLADFGNAPSAAPSNGASHPVALLTSAHSARAPGYASEACQEPLMADVQCLPSPMAGFLLGIHCAIHGQVGFNALEKVLPSTTDPSARISPRVLLEVTSTLDCSASDQVRDVLAALPDTSPEGAVLMIPEALQILEDIKRQLRESVNCPDMPIGIEQRDIPDQTKLKAVRIFVTLYLLGRKFVLPPVGSKDAGLKANMTLKVAPRASDDVLRLIREGMRGSGESGDSDNGDDTDNGDSGCGDAHPLSTWPLRTSMAGVVMNAPSDRYVELSDGSLVIQSRHLPCVWLLLAPGAEHFTLAMHPSQLPVVRLPLVRQS